VSRVKKATANKTPPRRTSSKFFPGKNEGSQRLLHTISRFAKTKVLVIGDIMLDHFIWGAVNRISPEAPVPVVHVESETLCPGGAANVFHNLQSLGGKADLCGIIGRDEDGKALLKQLSLSPKKHGGLFIERDRPTTKKTRILAHSQQVVRYDIESRHDISRPTSKRMLDYIESQLAGIGCVVISDYAKGVVTPYLMSTITNMLAQGGIPIVVDPKVDHLPYYAGVTVITPNHFEAEHGALLFSRSSDPVSDAGHHLRNKLGCKAVLVTRGEQGMTLCEEKGISWHIPTMARQVYDVTGAGDTVVSTLALALGAGASLREGAILANHAAGIVVGRIGTATVTAAELKTAIRNVYQ
jgi:D-beta-D-heptose 7-phosphate kinase/D-beta-D-heptose 1-phosphate adenosyltransferase